MLFTYKPGFVLFVFLLPSSSVLSHQSIRPYPIHHPTRSANLFNMITKKPEVSAAHNEYETAIGNLRAQIMTAPDEGMFEEQEMWCLEWQKRLTCLTTALRGLGLGMPPKDGPSFTAAHNTWKRWEVEAAIRRQEAKEQEVTVREAREREEEQTREEERARAAGSGEVGGGAEVDEPAEQYQEAGELEEDASAMVVSPVAMPTRKGKEWAHRYQLLSPTQGEYGLHPHSEAFDKGGKQGEEVEEEDNLAGNRVTEATAHDELRGNARRVVGGAIRRKGDRCTTCEEKKWVVCWGEDGRVCRQCQLKQVACSMSIKAKRDREVSKTSRASQCRIRQVNMLRITADSAQPSSGPSQIAGPACMAGGSNTMARLVDDVVETELLKYEGVSGVPNETINAVLSLVGQLAAQSLSVDAQLRAAKARLRDANVEMRDAIEGQKRYHEQLAALESQVTRLVQEAWACPLKDTLVIE
ncbi:hypothetical protein PAXRUDRAFT_129547 [Paxillus rubicundulus Ve08.2h10]|uniref:Zn(2)-C6 fungal-type domain-containing protein n=1 Tax=Paxillus rubicundulus Ve08.2h10 TaxID=930991 RepID=A0A0D0E6E7_9AGAM|nr:hypothetical protein PAXRUDRAFT_129547 [Paxillus rubicundulus Ve08.2h10]